MGTAETECGTIAWVFSGFIFPSPLIQNFSATELLFPFWKLCLSVKDTHLQYNTGINDVH